MFHQGAICSCRWMPPWHRWNHTLLTMRNLWRPQLFHFTKPTNEHISATNGSKVRFLAGRGGTSNMEQEGGWVCVHDMSHTPLRMRWKKKNSVAEVRHVSCQRPLHRKQADEKRLHWLHRGSVMQLSVYIKAHYIWRMPQLFCAKLIHWLALTPCLCMTE